MQKSSVAFVPLAWPEALLQTDSFVGMFPNSLAASFAWARQSLLPVKAISLTLKSLAWIGGAELRRPNQGPEWRSYMLRLLNVNLED